MRNVPLTSIISFSSFIGTRLIKKCNLIKQCSPVGISFWLEYYLYRVIFLPNEQFLPLCGKNNKHTSSGTLIWQYSLIEIIFLLSNVIWLKYYPYWIIYSDSNIIDRSRWCLLILLINNKTQVTVLSLNNLARYEYYSYWAMHSDWNIILIIAADFMGTKGLDQGAINLSSSVPTVRKCNEHIRYIKYSEYTKSIWVP